MTTLESLIKLASVLFGLDVSDNSRVVLDTANELDIVKHNPSSVLNSTLITGFSRYYAVLAPPLVRWGMSGLIRIDVGHSDSSH